MTTKYFIMSQDETNWHIFTKEGQAVALCGFVLDYERDYFTSDHFSMIGYCCTRCRELADATDVKRLKIAPDPMSGLVGFRHKDET